MKDRHQSRRRTGSMSYARYHLAQAERFLTKAIDHPNLKGLRQENVSARGHLRISRGHVK